MWVWSLEEWSGLAEDTGESSRAQWQLTLWMSSLRERERNEEKEKARMLTEKNVLGRWSLGDPGEHISRTGPSEGGNRKLGEDTVTEAEGRKSFKEGALGEGGQGSKAKAADEYLLGEGTWKAICGFSKRYSPGEKRAEANAQWAGVGIHGEDLEEVGTDGVLELVVPRMRRWLWRGDVESEHRSGWFGFRV